MRDQIVTEGYANDEVPTDEQVAIAIDTLVQLARVMGGAVVGAVERTTLDGTHEGTFHFNIHDASVCGGSDHGSDTVLRADIVDKSRMN